MHLYEKPTKIALNWGLKLQLTSMTKCSLAACNVNIHCMFKKHTALLECIFHVLFPYQSIQDKGTLEINAKNTQVIYTKSGVFEELLSICKKACVSIFDTIRIRPLDSCLYKLHCTEIRGIEPIHSQLKAPQLTLCVKHDLGLVIWNNKIKFCYQIAANDFEQWHLWHLRVQTDIQSI